MGLAETQRLMAHLYTDSGLRERFFTEPDSVGAEWDLSADDLEALRGLSAGHTEFFARSLQTKRLGEVRKLLPQTCRALGPRTVPLFRRFADQSVPSGLHKHRADALGFASFLERVLREETALPPWLLDLLRYEAGWLIASAPACRWYSCRTRRDIVAYVRGLDNGDTPLAFSRSAYAVWWRLAPNELIRHRIIGMPNHQSPRASFSRASAWVKRFRPFFFE